MAIDMTGMSPAMQTLIELIVMIVAIGLPLLVIAAIAYWVIRVAVRDGVLEALRRMEDDSPVEGEAMQDLVRASSPARRLLYAAGAVVLVVGMLMAFLGAPFGVGIAVIGLVLIGAYVSLFALDAARKPRV